jgi:ankyrin repeat protein
VALRTHSSRYRRVVEILLKVKEINVNSKDDDGFPTLFVPFTNGEREHFKMLLGHPEIDVNIKDRDGQTPLLYASSAGPAYDDEVAMLLAHPNIKVNEPSINGQTALFKASSLGKEGIVKLLLAHPNINVNIKTNPFDRPISKD